MALIKCNECGKEISEKATVCPNCGHPNMLIEKEQEKKQSLSTIKGTIGLISVAIFMFVGLRSCTLGLATTTYTDDVYNGFACASLMLIGGIFLFSTRKSKKVIGLIIGTIFYLISFCATLGTGSTTYKDLPFWGLISLLFAIICIILIIKEKKK